MRKKMPKLKLIQIRMRNETMKNNGISNYQERNCPKNYEEYMESK